MYANRVCLLARRMACYHLNSSSCLINIVKQYSTLARDIGNQYYIQDKARYVNGSIQTSTKWIVVSIFVRWPGI